MTDHANEDWAPPAPQDRVTDERSPEAGSPPSGSVPTGAGFVPGPWKTDDDWDATIGQRVTCCVDGRTFTVCQAETPIQGGHARHDLRKANARLIAAAPELFAACEKALNYIANTEGEYGITLDTGIFLRAALTKARGES